MGVLSTTAASIVSFQSLKARRLEAFRKHAESVKAKIEKAFVTRLENTLKRRREAMSARIEGYQWQRVQAALAVLARAWDCGTIPFEFMSINRLSDIYEKVRRITKSISYYEVCESTEYADRSELGVAFRAWIDEMLLEVIPKDIQEKESRDRKMRDINDKINRLKGMIPGFFPTPPAVCRMIIDKLIELGTNESQLILEPSAGAGHIADAIRDRWPKARLGCIEYNHSLYGILIEKGHAAQGVDFLAWANACPERFQRIAMNPPFERDQWAAHVRKAFSLLAVGGSIVAVLPANALSKRAASIGTKGVIANFLDWIHAAESTGVLLLGKEQRIPDGSFKESGSMVSTILIEIRRLK